MAGPPPPGFVSIDELSTMLSTGETAAALGLSTDRVRQMVLKGLLEPLVTPLGSLYHRADVVALRAARDAAKR